MKRGYFKLPKRFKSADFTKMSDGYDFQSINAECKCRNCEQNDVENGKWCKKEIEPSRCIK